mmetsp:Transcript_679/g.1970  ORF Transcript_679/g.1970 Transcript_679/m.1970 type:complete len:209 (+) Transcript_679:1180-1806(+)
MASSRLLLITALPPSRWMEASMLTRLESGWARNPQLLMALANSVAVQETPEEAGGAGEPAAYRAFFVSGPTKPSAVRPERDWKLLTADRVAGPKSPSTAMPAPWLFSRLCRDDTQAPVCPSRMMLGQLLVRMSTCAFATVAVMVKAARTATKAREDIIFTPMVKGDPPLMKVLRRCSKCACLCMRFGWECELAGSLGRSGRRGKGGCD